MLSRIRRKNSINSQSAFCTQSAVCILYPAAVCSLHFVLTGLVLLFLFQRASSPERNTGARKKILVRLSWPLWLICGLYVEELTRKSTMIGQWLIYTYWRRTQMRGLPIWTFDALSRGHSVCWNEPATGPLGVNISASRFKLHFQKFGIVIWGYYFFNHINILFLSPRVSELHRNSFWLSLSGEG